MSVRWQFLKIILIVIFLNEILSQGLCGPNKPSKTSDCLSYSNSTDLCCLLTELNAPSEFKSCIHLLSADAFTFMNVGSMQYSIDCKGIPNYSTYFPFESQYTPCGKQNPTQTSDCSAYDTTTTSCCMASIDPTFNYTNNILCYYFPNNNNLREGNFTERNIQGTNLYFSCSAGFSFVSLISIMFYFMVIIF